MQRKTKNKTSKNHMMESVCFMVVPNMGRNIREAVRARWGKSLRQVPDTINGNFSFEMVEASGLLG